MNNGNTKKFYGKYRGTVINNVDPLKMGRIQAIVPDVSNLIPTSFATPCVPILGIQMGIFTVPQIGSGVWIEFENGDPDKPIWSGCFPGSALDLPMSAQAIVPPIGGITLQTTLQNALVVSDMPPAPAPPVMPPVVPVGGVTLKSATGASIVVNDAGIFISNGKGATIMMVGPTITINNGALVII